MTNQNKLVELLQLVDTAQSSLSAARQVLRDLGVDSEADVPLKDKARKIGAVSAEGEQKVIEGVFDGQHMVGPDGKQYSVPANYASKSKLVEGDMLKLTITADGSFIYKQIGPVERARLVGKITSDETTGEFRVLAGAKSFRVLLASVTYFKGEPGDEIVVLVPKEGESRWAAVENIIKGGEVDTGAEKAETPAQPTDDAIDEIT